MIGAIAIDVHLNYTVQFNNVALEITGIYPEAVIMVMLCKYPNLSLKGYFN